MVTIIIYLSVELRIERHLERSLSRALTNTYAVFLPARHHQVLETKKVIKFGLLSRLIGSKIRSGEH